LASVLCDLVMYRCPALANKAFAILVRHYTQRHSFLETLNRMRLLANGPDAEEFQEVCVVVIVVVLLLRS
jgi:hypothetical protein